MMTNLWMGGVRHARLSSPSQVVARCLASMAIGCLSLITAAGGLRADDRADALINQLVERDRPVSADALERFLRDRLRLGTGFLPLDRDSDQKADHAKEEEDAVPRLICLGADAVPALIAHLDDDRPTKVGPFVVRGFHESLDWNTRSRSDMPLWGERVLWTGQSSAKTLENYHLTVGDLCYEILGQIVNRDYRCASCWCMGCHFTLPGRSSPMRVHLKKTWGPLSRERHRESLLSDFRQADSTERRIGAYLRLAFYYPDSVEEVVLAELGKPHYSTEDIDTFCGETLWLESDPSRRRQFVTDFVLSHNEAYDYGLQCAIRNTACNVEPGQELVRGSIALIARDVLLDVYNVVVTTDDEGDETVFAANTTTLSYDTTADRRELIRQLRHDQSIAVGRVVAAMLEQAPDDVELVSACLHCLANRNRADVLIRQLERVAPQAATTMPLHVAILEALVTSRDEEVRVRLRRFALATTNGEYFVASLDSVDRTQQAEILTRAAVLLTAIPADSADDQGVLSAVTSRFPEESLPLTIHYLKGSHPSRIVAVCGDIETLTDPRIPLLEPLLDDRRSVQCGSTSLEIRDVVARAIADTTEEIEYESTAPEDVRRDVIQRIKQHCQRLRTGTLEVHDPAVADQ